MIKMRGSQYLLVNKVNNDTKALNSKILTSSPHLLNEMNDASSITWISPLESDGYKEYRDDFLNVLGFHDKKISDDFWPKRGPVWDGLAKAKGKNNEDIILLVEAKAHLNEINSQLRAVCEQSRYTIKETFKKFFQENKIDETYATVWENEYYQLANRLVYLDYLNHQLQIKTYLVLINFVDDQSYKPTSLNEYVQKYQLIFLKMGIENLPLLDNIIFCYLTE